LQPVRKKHLILSNNRYIIFLPFLVFMISSCSSAKLSNSSSNGSFESEPRTTEEINSTSDLIMARRHLLNGDRDLAYQSLKRAVKENPNNDAAYFEISRIAQYSKNSRALKKALEYGKKALALDPDNIWYHKNLIGIYKRQKDYKQAVKQTKEIIKLQPDVVQHYYQLANMYIFDKDYKAALKVYGEIENRFGFEKGVIMQRKQIYLKLGSYGKALKEIDKLIAHSPNTKEYYGMKADIYMAQGEYDKAYKTLLKIQKIDPNDGRVHLVFADYYKAKGDNERAFKEVKTALGTPSLEMDTKIEVLLKYFNNSAANEKYRLQDEELMDTVLVANPNNAKALAMKADMLNRDGNYKEAIIYFRKVIAADSSIYLVWEQMLLVEQRLEDFPSMANESARALRLFPQQPNLYYFSGLANMEIQKYNIAEEHLKMGLNFVFDKRHKSEFYGLLAEAEFRQHKFGPAEDHFSLAVELNQMNARALKDYAYFLAYNNKELEKAKRLATSAYEMKPNEADYIYTYAFVLFKSGEIEKAKKWVREGVSDFPNHKKLQLLDMEINKNE